MPDIPSIVPYFSYVDAKAAIKFLHGAFGMTVVQSFEDDAGTIMHAELAYGNGVVMVGTADASRGSPGVYLVVEDVDAHYEQARAAGATIVYPPEDTEFGTRRYRTKDPEGHEWSFGTYQPKTEAPDWG